MKSRRTCTAPPAQPVTSRDIKVASANPINARDCGVFQIVAPCNDGRDTSKTNPARINPMWAPASGPNKVAGPRYAVAM